MEHTNRISELFDIVLPGRGQNTGSARQGLQILLLLRSFVTIVSALGLLLFQSMSTLEVPIVFILWLIGAVMISVLLGYWRLKASRVVSNLELFCHLQVDVVFLIILLLNTGGASNPLISYLLVLLAVTATLLPRVYVNTFAVGGILIYTSFLLIDLQVEQEIVVGTINQETTFQLHLVGMWVIFLVSAVLISVLITRMVSAIQDREINLAKSRENEMRSEQIVAIGTLSAGTAHALGTPLSTMAVLLTDLDKLDANELGGAEVKGDISVLKQQVSRCKHSLTQLARYYNKDNPDQEETLTLADFVNDIQDYIVNVHPAAPVTFTLQGSEDSQVVSNLSVKHAVINIIENGIKAANSQVEVTFKIISEDPSHFEISINDDGPGIPSEVMEQLGEPFISMRRESMGLGIFLANATIQRLGGTIEMFNLKLGGALTLIKLPLPSYQQA
jgi:two-component system sensor histidine kinase RegB